MGNTEVHTPLIETKPFAGVLHEWFDAHAVDAGRLEDGDLDDERLPHPRPRPKPQHNGAGPSGSVVVVDPVHF